MSTRKWTDDQLQQAVLDNPTFAGVLRQLGLSTSPGNYSSIHRHIQRLCLDTSHMLGQAHLRGGTHKGSKGYQDLPAILAEKSHYPSSKLRKRLIKEGLLANVCSLCGIPPEWNGHPLTLQLDHINGNHLDNRLENLRILCPNCHTQTETFTNKKGQGRYCIPAQPTLERVCQDCGIPITPNSTRCRSCDTHHKVQTATCKIQWPDIPTLRNLLEKSNFVQVGKELGVSDNAIRKHLRIHSAGGGS